MMEDTLFYNGIKPSIDYYHTSIQEVAKELYDLIPVDNWNAKDVRIKYLENILLVYIK